MRSAAIALLVLAAGGAIAQDTVERGAKVFRQAGCIACHKISGQGGPSGPDLTRVGAVRSEQGWFRRFLKDPASVVPGSRMPPFDDLSEDELRALTAYLLSLK